MLGAGCSFAPKNRVYCPLAVSRALDSRFRDFKLETPGLCEADDSKPSDELADARPHRNATMFQNLFQSIEFNPFKWISMKPHRKRLPNQFITRESDKESLLERYCREIL